jgi:hypothetical protein
MMHHSLRMRWWLTAAALPLLAAGTATYEHAGLASWFSLPATARQGVAGDALLYVAVTVILLAPLAGVLTVCRGTPRQRSDAFWFALATGGRLALCALIFVVTSAAVMATALEFQDDAVVWLLSSHLTLAAVGMSLAAFGALCGTTFADALDAAGCSLVTVLAASAGVFVCGSWLFAAPRPVVDAAIAVNPFVTIMAASQIDVARMSVPYQMSALAHVDVQYPVWTTACVRYIGAAVVCLAGVGVVLRAHGVVAALGKDRS